MSRTTTRTPHRWTNEDDAILERSVATLAARGLPPRVDLWSAICGLLAAEGLSVTPSAAATRYHRLVDRRRKEEAERQRRAGEDALIGSLRATLPGGECPCGDGLWSANRERATCRCCGRSWLRPVGTGAPGDGWILDPSTVPAEPVPAVPAPRVVVEPDAWAALAQRIEEYEADQGDRVEALVEGLVQDVAALRAEVAELRRMWQ